MYKLSFIISTVLPRFKEQSVSVETPRIESRIDVHGYTNVVYYTIISAHACIHPNVQGIEYKGDDKGR